MALTLLTLAAAATSDGHWDGPWWFFPPLFFLFWVAFAVTMFWLFGRGRRRWHDEGGFDAGARVLAERFARGEITHDEYNERLGQLRRAVQEHRRS